MKTHLKSVWLNYRRQAGDPAVTSDANRNLRRRAPAACGRPRRGSQAAWMMIFCRHSFALYQLANSLRSHFEGKPGEPAFLQFAAHRFQAFFAYEFLQFSLETEKGGA